MKEVNEKFQLVPPHIQIINSVERFIQYFKEDFISGLSSTQRDFPLHIWCQIHPHASLTLNLLRKSHMNPILSGYTQLHGEFKYSATPLSPPGTKIFVHEKPTVRGTWEAHGVKVWYLCTSMEHYKCHHVYITKTREVRDSEFVEFFHTLILYLTIIPQKMSSSRRKNWPMPCKN